MNIVTGIVVFQIIWWTIFMAVLPMGVQVEDKPEKGFATSAPVKPDLKRKIVLTTYISLGLWVGFFLVMQFELISFE